MTADRREYQRRYQRRWNAEHPERRKEITAKHHRKAREENMALLRRIKLERGCLDCGYAENADALQFDHVRGDKEFEVSSVAHVRSKMLRELEKCEVRCANCHAIRSADQRRQRMLARGVQPTCVS